MPITQSKKKHNHTTSTQTTSNTRLSINDLTQNILQTNQENTFTTSSQKEETNLKTKLNLSTYGVLANYNINGGLNLYAGAYYSPTTISADVSSNNHESGHISLSGNKIAPSFGINYNNAISSDDSGWFFNARLGITYMGKMKLKTELKNIDDEAAKDAVKQFEDKANKNLKEGKSILYPVLRIGATYKF